jgi:hypothetical protein
MAIKVSDDRVGGIESDTSCDLRETTNQGEGKRHLPPVRTHNLNMSVRRFYLTVNRLKVLEFREKWWLAPLSRMGSTWVSLRLSVHLLATMSCHPFTERGRLRITARPNLTPITSRDLVTLCPLGLEVDRGFQVQDGDQKHFDQ